VNTHANGDHCYGNQLLKGSQIIASAATAHEMSEVPPAMLAALNKAPGEVGDLFRHFFG
jgi:glyoxylase-like metal-dependent hydrolase (beta-lactamase superfamily II)